MLDQETSLADFLSKSRGLPPAGTPVDLASTVREQGERSEHDNNALESESCSKFVTPEDRPLFNSIQELIQEADPEDPL